MDHGSQIEISPAFSITLFCEHVFQWGRVMSHRSVGEFRASFSFRDSFVLLQSLRDHPPSVAIFVEGGGYRTRKTVTDRNVRSRLGEDTTLGTNTAYTTYPRSFVAEAKNDLATTWNAGFTSLITSVPFEVEV